MDMSIIVNDNGDISFFANIKDAELYLEPDDIKQNFYFKKRLSKSISVGGCSSVNSPKRLD